MLQQGYVSGKVNKIPLFNESIPQKTPTAGFVGIGTDSYGYADWEFLGLRNASDPIFNLDAIDEHVLRFESEKHGKN
jgi:hypothetical protein